VLHVRACAVSGGEEQEGACGDKAYGVVDEDDDAVLGQPEVGLDAGDALVGQGTGEGPHGVLRQLARRASVSDHERAIRRLH